MPTGILADLATILIGSLIGINFKSSIPHKLIDPLVKIFGISAVAIGIIAFVKIKSLPAVILSLILGLIIGELLDLDAKIKNLLLNVLQKFNFTHIQDYDEYLNFYAIVALTFCASGTNIFGAFSEGLNGDTTILISKAVMDIWASAIFASRLGSPILFILLPQSVIMLSLFFMSKIIAVFINSAMLADFIAIGGLLTIILGFSIIEVNIAKVINLLPCLIIVFPVSYIFSILF